MPLQPPPHDHNGEVVPHDHDGINVADGIIRRISPQHLIYDEKSGGMKISSAAFNPSSGPNGGMSVDLQAQIEEAGLSATQYVTSPPWLGSVRFTAGSLRAEGYQVGFDPLADNPYHGEVWGLFTKSRQRRLKQLCIWFVPIPGASI